eukprot:15213990-Alexandrium_andersonii.AAC.1
MRAPAVSRDRILNVLGLSVAHLQGRNERKKLFKDGFCVLVRNRSPTATLECTSFTLETSVCV